jgi:hypothetical protein
MRAIEIAHHSDNGDMESTIIPCVNPERPSYLELADIHHVLYTLSQGMKVGDVISMHEAPSDEDTADQYDDSMDGDAASALASAGFGTDKDYGYYGGDDY